MRRKKHRVQKKFLRILIRKLFSLQVVAKAYIKSIQRLSILKETIIVLEVKNMSDTGWKSRIDSVKVMRQYLHEMPYALESHVDISFSK